MAGTLWVWGSNSYGVLGDNDFPNPKSSPVQTIAGGSNWQTASTKAPFGAAIKTDGTLWAWGRNSYGQVGDDTTVNKSSPVQTVTFSTDWASVDCGSSSIAAIKKDGTLWTWGSNSYGQLGDDTSTNRSSPVQTAAFGNNWQQVSGGYAHKAAIKTDGTLWVWGYNYDGQLGDGTKSSVNKRSPLQTVSYGTDWSSVKCGNSFTVAIKKDGTLWAWGKNSYGQLGINTTTSRSSPVQEITGGTNWNTVACGYAVTVATKTDGTLWAWGSNFAGELGDNTLSLPKSSPVQTIAGGTNWASAHAGGTRAGGLKKDGTLWMWGANYPNGQMGDDSTTDKSSPVQTVMGGTGWSSLSIGEAVFAINSPPQPSLSVNTAPAYVYSGKQFGVQPVIYILDPSLVLDTGATDAVTVTVTSGNATISGTNTVNAVGGIITYTNLVLTGYGLVTLNFSATGITSTSVNVNVEIAGAILPKRSETAYVVPTSGQLLVGELAINIADRKGYVKKSDGTIVNVFSALSSGAITSGVVGDAAVLSGNIASGQIGISHLASGVLSSITLSSGQVTSGTIASGSVSQFKLSSGAVNSGQIGNNAVVSGSIASGSIHTFHISSGSITTNLIASGTIISEDLSNEVIVSGKVSSGVIAWFNLASGAVRSGNIGDASVVSGSIASGSIGWSAVSSGVVRSGHIGNGSVVSGSVASGQIGAFHLASGVISTATLGSGQVVSGNIASGTVGWFALSSGAVRSGHIANAAVVSGSIASGQVGFYHLASGLNATAAGNNTEIQYNLSGSFAGATALNYNRSGTYLTVTATSGGNVPLGLKAASIQSGNIMEIQNSSGARTQYCNPSGGLYGFFLDGGAF